MASSPAGIQHRLVRFADAVDAALDEVAEIDPTFASTADKKATLLGLRRAHDRSCSKVKPSTGHRPALCARITSGLAMYVA